MKREPGQKEREGGAGERGRQVQREEEEEEWVVVVVVVGSCSVSRGKKRKVSEKKEAVNEQIVASIGSCRVQRTPGTVLTSITSVEHMCVYVDDWVNVYVSV